MQDKEDQLIKKMAKLLQEGATMLDKVCPQCNTLIYRLPNKKIICPSCNKEIIIQKENSLPQKNLGDVGWTRHDFSSIRNTVFSKIELLSQTLQTENDIYQIEKLIAIIDKVLQIYERIGNLHTPSREK